jgi:RHS repeat-associated protein
MKTTYYSMSDKEFFYYHPNHLASTMYVTDEQRSVTQSFLYAPFGEITNEYNNSFGSSILPKYSFNAKELDEETGMYYYEARYMAPPVFISRDPLFEKYPTFSPYAYCANNPVKYVDPDGREGITVSGSPGDHKNKRHFLENGLDRSKQATAHFQRKGEKSTWIIYNDKKKGYTADLLKEYTKKAEKAGINVKVVSDVKEIIDYVNNKNGNDTRARDKITSFYYVGHAKPGDLKVGYNGTEQDFDPSNFKAEAFSSGTYVDVVGGCRTAVDWGLGFIDPSIIKQFSKILDSKSEIHGSSVRVQYNGGIMTNKQLLKENNGEEVIIKGRLK